MTMIERYRTRNGKWLWAVGTGTRHLLLDDNEVRTLINDATEALNDEHDRTY